MNEQIAIRRGDYRDRAFVLDLGRRVAATSISSVRPTVLPLVENAFERLLAFIEFRAYDMLIAGDTEPLGFLLLLRDMPDEVTSGEQAFVAYMAVEPRARRRGVARSLLLAAEEIALAAGLPHLSLMVTEDNLEARALYEAVGFATERRMMTKPT